MGYGRETIPTVDRMAKNGLYFENAITQVLVLQHRGSTFESINLNDVGGLILCKENLLPSFCLFNLYF